MGMSLKDLEALGVPVSNMLATSAYPASKTVLGTSCWGISSEVDTCPTTDISSQSVCISSASTSLDYSKYFATAAENSYFQMISNHAHKYINEEKEKENEKMGLTSASTKVNFKPFDEVIDKDGKKKKVIRPGIGSEICYGVENILFNPPAMIVFWKDKTKTIVKCSEGETFNPYYGFCAALAKKVYGCNSRVNKIVDKYNNPKKEEKKKSNATNTKTNKAGVVTVAKKLLASNKKTKGATKK